MNQTQKRFIVLPRHGFYLTTAAATNELQPIIELKKVKTLRTMKCGALVVLTTDEIAASINLAWGRRRVNASHAKEVHRGRRCAPLP